MEEKKQTPKKKKESKNDGDTLNSSKHSLRQKEKVRRAGDC